MKPNEHPFSGTERFVVLRRLGVGAMGVVYEVLDRAHDQLMALKTIRDAEQQLIYRLKKEFRALAEINHPNLVRFHELHSEGERWFFTMELIDGVSFLDHVRSHGACDLLRLRQALGELAEGVAAVHRAGKLHRDLKPSNVLVTRAGRIKICDFGLVTAAANEWQTRSRHARGTPAFMSPEQAANQPLSEASDWYSVGAILFRALTGQAPFSGSALVIMRDKQLLDPPAPADLVDGVPHDLNQLCVGLLQRRPEHRPSEGEVLACFGRKLECRQAPLFGRESLLSDLEDAFVGAQRAAQVVFVEGDPGVGKSTLVRRFVERRSAVETLVLQSRCSEDESVPRQALDGLIDALTAQLRRLPRPAIDALLPNDLPALVRLFPVLRRVDGISHHAPEGAAHGPVSSRRAVGALGELLRRLASQRRIVLFIDDVQWGDAESAALLLALLESGRLPLLVVLAGASVPGPWLDLGRAAAARRLVVDPLSPTEARNLALAKLGRNDDAARACAERVASESGGHPQLVHELVEHAGNEPATAERADLSLGRALAARLGRLPLDAQIVMRLVAVADGPLERKVLDACAHCLGVNKHAALAILRPLRLVRSHGDRIAPYHERFRELVVASLTPLELRGYRKRLAAAAQLS